MLIAILAGMLFMSGASLKWLIAGALAAQAEGQFAFGEQVATALQLLEPQRRLGQRRGAQQHEYGQAEERPRDRGGHDGNLQGKARLVEEVSKVAAGADTGPARCYRSRARRRPPNCQRIAGWKKLR